MGVFRATGQTSDLDLVAANSLGDGTVGRERCHHIKSCGGMLGQRQQRGQDEEQA